MIIVTPKLYQNNVSRRDNKILQKSWTHEQYAKFMSEPNPTTLIQIPLWESSNDDDKL